jgi:RNA polymerase sigma-70 factor (ECF subfamily)
LLTVARAAVDLRCAAIMAEHQSTYVQHCLLRLQQGEEAARADLLRAACERLTELARTMLKNYRRVKRWEATDDVLQGALLRLHRALEVVTPPTACDFYRLATAQIRRELIDLARHYFGPAGMGSNLDSAVPEAEYEADSPLSREQGSGSLEPSRLAAWTEFHEQVLSLPEQEQEVFDLVWYQGLKLTEAADLLSVSARTVTRRWQAACLKLHQALQGILPGS